MAFRPILANGLVLSIIGLHVVVVNYPKKWPPVKYNIRKAALGGCRTQEIEAKIRLEFVTVYDLQQS